MPGQILDRLSRSARLGGAALVIILCLLLACFGALWSWPQEGFPLDWGSFVASGRAAAAGLDPYSVYPLTLRAYDVWEGIVEMPNLNPPISVLAFRAVAAADPAISHRVWYIVSLATYACALALLLCGQPRGVVIWRSAWALSLAALWHTLQLGQIYAPLLLAAAGAWVLLRKGRHLQAGILIGLLVAIKPNFALWPLLLLLGGHGLSAGAAAASAALVSLLPVLTRGPRIYAQWLAASGSFRSFVLPGNSSLLAVASRLGVPWLGILLTAVLVVGTATLVWRRRPSALVTSSLGVVVSLLASPICWLGYTMLLLPALLARRWTLPLQTAAIILTIPFALVVQWFQPSRLHFAVFGSIYVPALLLVLLESCREALRR